MLRLLLWSALALVACQNASAPPAPDDFGVSDRLALAADPNAKACADAKAVAQKLRDYVIQADAVSPGFAAGAKPHIARLAQSFAALDKLALGDIHNQVAQALVDNVVDHDELVLLLAGSEVHVRRGLAAADGQAGLRKHLLATTDASKDADKMRGLVAAVVVAVADLLANLQTCAPLGK